MGPTGRASVVHIVDDDADFQGAMVRLLRAAGFEVRAYASAEEFLRRPPGSAPGCVLLDLNMPGTSGLDLQAALVKQGVSMPIIFLSGRGEIPDTVQAMKAGAQDFLTKPVPREVLLAAIGSALAKESESRASRERVGEWRQRYETLTERERQVFERVVAGKLNKVIGGELGVAERTVKAYRANVMEKMGARSLAELVHIADDMQAAGFPISGAP